MEEKVYENIAISSFWNFIMVLFGRLGGLIFVIILARFLLPEGFGIYNLAVSIALILLVMVDTGINQSLLKYVADSIGNKNKKLAAAESTYLLKLKIFFTLFLAMILILLAYPLSFFVFSKPNLLFPLMFVSLYLISYSLGSFYNSYFYIIKKVEYLTIKQFFFELTRILGVILIFIFIAKRYYIIGAIGVLAATMFLATIFLIYNLKKLAPFLFEKSDEQVDKKRIFKFFIYLGILGSFLVIFGYIDIIMIGIFLDASYVGFYSAAFALVAGIWSFLNIYYILLPVFTKMNQQDLQESLNYVFKYLYIIAIPAIFGIFVLGGYIVKLIYGIEYLPAVFPFYILSLLILMTPLASIIESLFSAREKPKYLIKIIILSTILGIILNYIFITIFIKTSSHMAIVGVAIATVISQTFYLLGILLYTKKELNISLDLTHLTKPLIASAIMALILFSINLMIDLNLIIGILEILLGAIIYFSVMFLIKGIGKKDIHLLKKIFKDLKSR
jgi:O-antigen/teichoic acid export membrane protein